MRQQCYPHRGLRAPYDMVSKFRRVAGALMSAGDSAAAAAPRRYIDCVALFEARDIHILAK